jgi:hypothetical protein
MMDRASTLSKIAMIHLRSVEQSIGQSDVDEVNSKMAILKGLRASVALQEALSAMARELAAARRDLELLLKLLNKARDEQTRAKQAAEREAAELRKALQEERDRASRLERDLAVAGRDVETQTALAHRAAPPRGPALACLPGRA